MYNLPPREITREIMFNVGGPNGFTRWFIYIPFVIILFFLIRGLLKKLKIWKIGKSEIRHDRIPERLKGIFTQAIAQTKILRKAYAGVMHASIVWGFIVLTIGTTLIFVQEDFTALIFGENGKFLYGNFYLIYSLLLDFFGVVAIIGTLMAIYRRYVTKPKQLDNKPADLYALLLIFGILVTGFISEGLRIAITNFPVFEVWSPIGWILGKAFLGVGLSESAMVLIHKVNWWIHFALSMIFILALVSGKLLHIFASSANIFFRNLGPKGKLGIIPPAEFEKAESFGVSKVEDFTWKQLFDGDACTRCGRCEDVCPATNTDKPLSPKKIIQDVNDNLYANSEKILMKKDEGKKNLIGDSVQEDELWSCTNCAACQEECPVQIEHLQKITDMRRHMVLMEGKMDEAVQNTFRNMETNGNPYGIGFSSRGDWAKDTGIKTMAEDSDVDYLYYVGCAGSFDDRNKNVAKALIALLQKAGLKVGILGEEETCCGDSALRIGNEYLFQMLAQQNIETFKRYNIKRVITTCPHGYNVFKKEYRDLGAEFEVFHHSEILAKLIRDGSLKIDKGASGEPITYHDSCMLGRYNEIYDAPREVLSSVNNNLVELSNNKSNSFCCGGGGGRMWMEENLGTRINHKRFEEIEKTSAGTVGTACPFCLTMFFDASKEKGLEEQYHIKDIAEILLDKLI